MKSLPGLLVGMVVIFFMLLGTIVAENLGVSSANVDLKQGEGLLSADKLGISNDDRIVEEVEGGMAKVSEGNGRVGCARTLPTMVLKKEVVDPLIITTKTRRILVVLSISLELLNAENGQECSYSVTVIDGLPQFPFDVPREDAARFTQGHAAESLLHRKYDIRLSSAHPTFIDNWNYTLLLKPLGLTPLNDTIVVRLPIVSGSLSRIGEAGDSFVFVEEKEKAPRPIVISLDYVEPSIGPWQTLLITLAVCTAILFCHMFASANLRRCAELNAQRFKSKSRDSQERSTTEKPVEYSHTTTPDEDRAGDIALSAGTATSDGGAGGEGAAQPRVHRFRASEGRKRFTSKPAPQNPLDF